MEGTHRHPSLFHTARGKVQLRLYPITNSVINRSAIKPILLDFFLPYRLTVL
jgi:hypothetical protein